MNVLINIDVGDVSRAIEFYTRAFDLRVGRRRAGSAGVVDFVELIGASSALYLLVKPAGTVPCAGAVRDYGWHWTPVHLDFVVEDIVRAVERVLTAGATQEGEVEDHAYGRLALFADPFGNGFCLLQFTGGGYDEIATIPEADTG